MRYLKFVLKAAGIALIVIVSGLSILIFHNLRDQSPGYKADLKVISQNKGMLSAGFSAVKITPEVPDRWTDSDNNARYEPKKGDTFTDGNGNGKFDPVWIAGFGNSRAANGIHDDLWARTMIIDDGKTRIALVVLDFIGFMNNAVIDVRKMIPESCGVTYTIISSTHTHEGPDMLGLWGPPFRPGVNREYLETVKKQIVVSVENAVAALRPAKLEISEDISGTTNLVKDTRDPQVFDPGLRVIKVVDKADGKTLGSLAAWGDHPETLWGKNLLITSDFPHYVRKFIEEGIYNGDTLKVPGIGGTAIYINGAVGGLMTTHPSIKVKDPFTGKEFSDPTFKKAESEGKQIAMLALKLMEKPADTLTQAGISVIVRTLTLPIDNKMFRLATALGILNRGTAGWMKMRTELAVLNIGPLSFATLPGEVYPEIINGGIEAPAGQDFNTGPLEIPPVREMMNGKYKFIFGLTNDEIGYIIPKSQWDAKEPFTYGRKDAPYGEENSLGSGTAFILHSNLKEMLTELNSNDR